MNARDLMNRDVVTVRPDTPLRQVARTLLEHRMSAVPVVDDGGNIVGMVSEGDLVGRKKTERETRSEWWLMRLAEGEPLSSQFLEHLESPLAVAREVMSGPVLTVGEETSTDEIASLMGTHRIKRLPVVSDGRIVGVVRRADLLRTIGGGEFKPVPLPPTPPSGPAAWIDHLDSGVRHEEAPARPAEVEPRRDAELMADDFRRLVAHHKEEQDRERARQRELAAELAHRNLRRLIDKHISDNRSDGLVHDARAAAELGKTEFLLLRFPSQLCSDSGRAVNAPDPEWPRTLRGPAAEMYLRWERELRPRGFRLVARVVEFPDGIPGDIGLYLGWGA